MSVIKQSAQDTARLKGMTYSKHFETKVPVK